MPDITRDDDAITSLLRDARRIAVVGASSNPARDSHRIFAYLRSHGYDALPVNPREEEVQGVAAVPDLRAANDHWGDDPIDIVDVFRHRDATPEVARAAVDAGARSVWFQFGTDHPDAVKAALDAGLDVVADRCIKIEHGRLVGD